MKRKVILPVLTTILLVSGVIFQNNLKAQDWSPAQKEVWKVETDLWTAFSKGDEAGFLDYFHPDYMGWDDNSPLPNSKTDLQKWFHVFMQGSKVLIYDIKPVGIKVYGDFAILDYYYSLVTDMDGKKKAEEGRWTDILMKQGNKWLLIGDNGGENKKNHED